MARMTRDDALPLILAQIQSSGGNVLHRELVAALEAAGNGNAVEHIPALKKAGKLNASVKSVSEGVTELYYQKGDK